MITFVMLTHIAPNSFSSPRAMEDLERAAMDRIRAACPGVAWDKSYAALGRYDHVDVFRAPDIETAMKVADLMRAHGHADTEVWPVVERDDFRQAVPRASKSEPELLLDAP
jgi:uncharacterized protein with GYD domain